MHYKRYLLILLSVLTVSISMFAGCTQYAIESLWSKREITIDGSDKDWRNATFHDEHTNCALGVMNDSENIYVSLTPWDRRVQGQIITSGLTVWFDKTGKEEKSSGITFPVVGTYQEGLEHMTTHKKEAGLFIKKFAESQKEILLIESVDKEPITLSLDEAKEIGIDVAIGDSDGRLSYELKVPLSSTVADGFSISSNPGDEIHIGFETGQMPHPEEDEDSNYRRYIRNGERSSSFISDRSKRSSRQYQPIADRRHTAPFQFWVKIDLAEN